MAPAPSGATAAGSWRSFPFVIMDGVVSTSPLVQDVSPESPNPVRVITGRYAGPEGERVWRLAVPDDERAGERRPVLVMLHGCLQDAADIARGSRFDRLAEQYGALVLYPEQPVSANPRKCWNWFDAAHQARGQGEPALLSALVGDVVQRHGGDPARVHLAGISAGAAMANLMLGAYPEQFASITTIAGVAWRAATNVGRALTVMQQGAGDSLPSGEALLAVMGERRRAVPVLVVHGAADNVVSVRNAEETARQYVQLHDALGGTAAGGPLLRRELSPYVEHGYSVREAQWGDSAGRVAVTLLRVDQLGHAFPFGDASGTFTDAGGPDLVGRLAALLATRK